MNKNIPCVSVVIPVYNVGQYLGDCLQSVVNQTLKNIEIICVNDGSTDHTAEILSLYQEKDLRIEIITLGKNTGPSNARNTGMASATGEFLYFLDSDDMIVKNSLENLYFEGKNNNLDIICFDGVLDFENESLKKRFSSYSFERNVVCQDICKGIDLFVKMIKNRDTAPNITRQFFKRDFIVRNNINFYDGILHEDILFFFISMLEAKRVKCLSEKYYIRRFRENSIMTVPFSIRNFEGYFISFWEMLFYWKSKSFSQDINIVLEYYFTKMRENIVKRYQELIDKNEKIQIGHAHEAINYLLKIFMKEKTLSFLGEEISKEMVTYIKKFPYIVIYGAGKFGRETLEFIDKCDLKLYSFIVTKKEGNSNTVMGHGVLEIKDLLVPKEKCVVLISVNKNFQEDIINRLDYYQFKNRVLMV